MYVLAEQHHLTVQIELLLTFCINPGKGWATIDVSGVDSGIHSNDLHQNHAIYWINTQDHQS